MQIDIDKIVKIAQDAGLAIMEIYGRDFNVEYKEDESPLTEADEKSNDVIVKGLQEAYPDIPILSEETKQAPYEERKDWDTFWLVDPLDGTKEFVKRNGEFTVNIALISGNRSVLGVIYVPVVKKTYYAMKEQGSFLIDETGEKTLLKKKALGSKIRIAASRSHLNDATQAFVNQKRNEFEEVEFISAGSSLKFCLVAEGKADFYPRFAPTMEWDTGAGQIVAEEAGATVTIAETTDPLIYNKENLLNPYFLVQ